MITFVTWLRCLGAMLITNAHYTGIYPTDIIANGGLVGDILFFSVSGFCLVNINTNFGYWYGKRLSRILPAVILITVIFALCGQYDLSVYPNGTENTILYTLLTIVGVKYPVWVSWFIYPTYYHFVGSILILYIPYYFIMKKEKLRENLPAIMIIIFVVFLLIYIFAYDKTYYHIDTVREPIIRFLYMESMLLGAWFRLNDEKFRNKGKIYIITFATIITFCLYFASKSIFSKTDEVSSLQIVNPLIIFVLLFFLIRLFEGIDHHLESVPNWLQKTIGWIASITLEIYLVQYVIIDLIRDMGLVFPINWLILTAIILVSAWLLHIVVDLAIKPIAKLIAQSKVT